VGENVEHVSNRDNPCCQRNDLAAQAVAAQAVVASAIPALLMTRGDLLGHLQQWKAISSKDFGPNLRVRLGLGVFFVVELAGLQQHAIGNTNFPYIMKWDCLSNQFYFLVRQTDRARKHRGKLAQLLSVLTGDVVRQATWEILQGQVKWRRLRTSGEVKRGEG